jgi:hypothetical protein
VTTAPATAATWHTDICVLGEPYPTRTLSPDADGWTTDFFDLPDHLTSYPDAIHEAGHAVIALAGGGHLHYATIAKDPANPTVGGTTFSCGLSDATGRLFATFTAAGERAIDRWLHQAGMWTPERAVAAEVGARSDRHQFLRINPDVGFGDKPIDYRAVHDLADQAVYRHWNAITTVADALVQRLHITGDDIARICGLPNRSYCTA